MPASWLSHSTATSVDLSGLGTATSQEPSGGLWSLANNDQKLVFSRENGLLAYQSFVRNHKGDWEPGSLAANTIVFGPSFGFMADSGRLSTNNSESTLQLRGIARAREGSGQPLIYSWESEITNPNGSPWFRFKTRFRLPQPLALQQGQMVEPQIIVWLSSTPTMMEGQSGSWRRVLLAQPTQNSLGAYGNDLPAVYLQDQNRGVETMMYFEIGDMGWMSLENIPRFLAYRCSTTWRLEPGGTQKLGLGLVADQATGDVLPAGEVQFTYWLLQRRLTELVTQQEAVTRWMEALFPLLQEDLAWPKCATTWRQFAEGTAEDLQQSDLACIDVNGHRGLLAYVKGSSKLWKPPSDDFELMTLADVVWPSLLYLRVQPPSPKTSAFEDATRQLINSLPFFYRSKTRSISNSLIPREHEVADSWYPFENGLIKYPMIGMLTDSKELTGHFLEAFGSAQKMAYEYDYLFSIYYQVDTLRAEGAGTNYAVGGLYAWGALLAHRLTGEELYRDEARRAIQALKRVPADRLFHEPQELAFGALAAAELGMQDAVRYLLNEQLRMFYWYSDPSQKSHDIKGMVQAAASILYPAFKENVEAILPWTGIMRRGVLFPVLLRFMDQQRRNNFYFFSNCAGNPTQESMRFIPFENLGTLELGGQTGDVGKEIYGGGEVLWMYLMFEALGIVSNRDLMLVNLDLLDTFDAQAFPGRELNFILFNPTTIRRSVTVAIPPARGAPVRLTAEGKPVSGSLEVPGGAYFRLKAEY